jgi:hypothetical protein
MKPSDFSKVWPWSSVTQNAEHEQIAVNIMKVLKRTGDEFRLLEWDEYKTERLKDGNFSEREHSMFDKCMSYCESSDTTVLFSPEWNNLKT